MKPTRYLLLLAVAMIISSYEIADFEEEDGQWSTAIDREFYQLKTYTFTSDEQVQITDYYLQNALLPALRKLELGPIGVFKSRLSETDTVRKTWVLIPFSSLEKFQAYEDELGKDAAYLAAGAEYLNAIHQQPPYQRIESVLLRAFVDMPKMYAPSFDTPRADRVYELRSYESPTEALYRNKVDMFNAGGEVTLFNRLQFNAVFYGEVLSGAHMPNLMYMTTFQDQASRESHWRAFRTAPEWVALKAMPKYQNNVSHVDIFFLYPTEYSDY